MSNFCRAGAWISNESVSEGLGVVEVEDAGAEDALVFGLYGLGL